MPQDANLFSLDGIPEPWSQVFDWLTNGALAQCLKAGELDAATDVQLRLGFSYLHWAVKLKFNPQHPNPIPTPRNQKEACKPWGGVIAKTIELCEAAWTTESGYPCAAQWFYEVALEGAITNPFVSINASNRKRRGIKKLIEENGSLEDRSNPFDRNEYPHTFRLIEATLQLAGEESERKCQSQNSGSTIRQSFKVTELLQGFTKARRHLSSVLDKNPLLRDYSEDEHGKPFMHLGGKGRRKISMLNNILDKNSGKEIAEDLIAWADGKLESLHNKSEYPKWVGSVAGLTLFRSINMLMNNRAFWSGTASELLILLNNTVASSANPDPQWVLPKKPNLLSKELKKIISSLETWGLLVVFDRRLKQGTKVIYLSRCGVACSLLPRRVTLACPPFPAKRNTGLVKWLLKRQSILGAEFGG